MVYLKILLHFFTYEFFPVQVAGFATVPTLAGLASCIRTPEYYVGVVVTPPHSVRSVQFYVFVKYIHVIVKYIHVFSYILLCIILYVSTFFLCRTPIGFERAFNCMIE